MYISEGILFMVYFNFMVQLESSAFVLHGTWMSHLDRVLEGWGFFGPAETVCPPGEKNCSAK
jgi:hypothetical protein